MEQDSLVSAWLPSNSLSRHCNVGSLNSTHRWPASWLGICARIVASWWTKLRSWEVWVLCWAICRGYIRQCRSQAIVCWSFRRRLSNVLLCCWFVCGPFRPERRPSILVSRQSETSLSAHGTVSHIVCRSLEPSVWFCVGCCVLLAIVIPQCSTVIELIHYTYEYSIPEAPASPTLTSLNPAVSDEHDFAPSNT